MPPFRVGFLSISSALALLAGCAPMGHHNGTPQPTTAPAVTAASIQHGPTLADLTGGQLGIGGGFLIGAAPDKVANHERQDAISAATRAEEAPASLLSVRKSKTADLNNDGYVTLDEVVAMARAGLSPQEISDRLRATGYVFATTPEQERYLTDRGVKPDVISTLHSLTNNTMAMKEQ